jgi:hypothetical protein
MWPAVFNYILCWGAATWGSATIDNRLYHFRSCDWGGQYSQRDPETGTYLVDNQVLIVRKPEGAYASLYPEFAGDVGSIGGINEKGIGVSELSIFSNDTTFKGINGAIRMRMLLDYASTAEEALAIMTSNRTCAWNFIVSDGQIPEGYALEQTANLSYVGTWDHYIESSIPFWNITDVVRRGNIFINPELAATERNRYDPSGFLGFVLFLLQRNMHFTPWRQYLVLSQAMENQWSTLNLNTSMSMLRDVYQGKTDLIFRVMQRLEFYPSYHQWVACPETGDMVISFGDPDTKACDNTVHYFNLFDLMDAEPRPSIRITRPREGYRYRLDVESRPTFSGNTVIFGNITVETSGSSTIEWVDFYVDDWLIASDATYPYEYTWDEKAFFAHTIKVVAHDVDGNTAGDAIDVLIFNR